MSRFRIGVDVGALTVKAVRVDGASGARQSAYGFHHGEPVAVLRELLQRIAPSGRCDVTLAGSAAGVLPTHESIRRIDDVQAMLAGVAVLLPGVRNILDIGGAGLRLVRLGPDGAFAHFSSNSQCAAGTGSFLDEQATRLGLTHDAIAALAGVDDPPPVATRCAVFAKSDLIHLQQTGATLEQMWSGLCRGMAQTALQTLLRGKPLGGPTALVGGVALNREVLRWLAALADAPVRTSAEAHVATALGAALAGATAEPVHPGAHPAGNGARKGNGNGHGHAGVHPMLDWRDWLGGEARRPTGAGRPAARVQQARPGTGGAADPATAASGAAALAAPAASSIHQPLALVRTRYPSFDVLENFTDDAGNEVRVSRWPAGDRIDAYLGIDIGSTSTKLCLVDEQGDVLVDVYRKTAGDPIGATQRLFDALRGLETARGVRLDVRGCGTTGSGRKLVGAVVGADAIVNEISAHVAGAMHVDPELDTIFEIGGQDSKYMRTRHGAIVDSNMNYVCAAGTGSFVEEQARKLGVPLPEVGDRVLGLVPPPSSDRCTVFMEQDVLDLLRAGHDVDHALAAVLRSVVQNYLNKVVGSRPWSRTKIGFQGATARNKGLVAAFETLLDVEMVVSPYCHVMGAWGVALLVREQMQRDAAPSTFAGLELSDRRIELRKERCELCNNACEITYAHIEGSGDEPSWGYLCGRDPAEERVRVHREFDAFRQRRRWLLQEGARERPAPAVGSRRPRVVVPRALTFWSHLPLWRRLLEELGAQVELAPESARSTRERGAALVGAEFCFPVKLAHGQVGEALDDDGADWVLLPRMVAQPAVAGQSDSYFCPYVQGFPSVAEAAIGNGGNEAARILSPVFDQRLPENEQAELLHRALGPALGATRRRVRDAYRTARASQARFEERCRTAGREALDKLAREKRPGIVLVGRPYNLNDPAANLDLPRKIAEMGYPVLPIDFLPFEPERISTQYRNTYWAYGQRILSALQQVRENESLFAIYFTNFNCGPDSFLLSYAEEIMGDKPMLALELDEHGADAGYITRIEAFLDVVRNWQPVPTEAVNPVQPAARFNSAEDDFRRRRIWIPPMHPVSSELFAAAFRGAGYDAVAIPRETRADLARGQRMTRGCECLPMRTTVGSFLNAIEGRGERTRQHALFMPTATGPCRFGQYATLDRLILDRTGNDDIPILSPSGDNAYCGLPQELRRALWNALLAADVIDRLACRVRPYEQRAGDADAALERWRRSAAVALERHGDLLEIVERAGAEFARIPTHAARKPLVGIVGEIYVRNSVFCNEDLVRSVERAGGEAWPAPIPEWILFTTWQDAHRPMPRTPKGLLDRSARRLRLHVMERTKTAYWKAAGPLLADRHEPGIAQTVRAGQRYIPFNVGGETLISLGRAVHFVEQGAALIVNASPFGCMPGTIAAGLFSRFEHDTSVPVVSLFYEGTGGVNRQLDVFLANLGGKRAADAPQRAVQPAPAAALDRDARVWDDAPVATTAARTEVTLAIAGADAGTPGHPAQIPASTGPRRPLPATGPGEGHTLPRPGAPGRGSASSNEPPRAFVP